MCKLAWYIGWWCKGYTGGSILLLQVSHSELRCTDGVFISVLENLGVLVLYLPVPGIFFFFFTFLKLFLELLSPFLATRTFFSSLPFLLAVSSGRNGGCGNISMPPAQSLLCHPNWLLAKECLRPLRYHSVIFFSWL